MIHEHEDDIDIDIDWELRRFPEAFWDVNVQPINAHMTEAGTYSIVLEDRKEILKDILSSQKPKNAEYVLIQKASAEVTEEPKEPVEFFDIKADVPPTEGEIAYAGSQLRVAIVALRLLRQNKTGDVERETLLEAINMLENRYTLLMRGEM